jgi:organic radical activating enzyme
MKILNVRLGLATNSSSTHSLVFLPKGVNAEEIDSSCGDYSFGWDPFQLTNKDSKNRYLSSSLFTQLKKDLGAETAESVTREWCGTEPNQNKECTDDLADGYVDHQSALAFPHNWDGKGINKDFFDDFMKFIMRDNIIIAGGNDNSGDEEDPPILHAGGIVPAMLDSLPTEDYQSPRVARKDGEYWTIFNRENGSKIRITFEGDEFQLKLKRSSSPELIDVKITNYCSFNCEYCYQDSTKQGKHGDTAWIKSLALKLKEEQVFEVALGGGETTLHPDFVDILKEFRENGVVPNFTTKNFGWLKDYEKYRAAMNYAGAFAFSCETAADVEKLGSIVLVNKEKDKSNNIVSSYFSEKVTIQHVIGTANEEEFREILLACSKHMLPITLLGYKQVGRGPGFKLKPSSKWLEIISEVLKKKYIRIGIDTALADAHWDELIKAGVKEKFMTRKEGQFSCYIDAVEKTINTSSYTNDHGIPMSNEYNVKEMFNSLPW